MLANLLTSPVRLARDAMGTRFELIFGPGDPGRLRAAGEEALAEIERLDRQLSAYRPSSEVSWLNALASRGPVIVEPRLFALLERCQALSRATNGAFDITVGPLMRAWAFVHGTGRIPAEDEWRAAESSVGWQYLDLDTASRTVCFRRPGMRIDLGAIGKGFAVDAAIQILRSHEIDSALLHGGTSSIHTIGGPEQGQDWRIAWNSPAGARQTFEVRDAALSVSAIHGKCFEAEGRVLGHVMDPRTGAPTMAARAVVMTGPRSLECDALSTALLVSGPEWVDECHRRFPQFAACVM
jgi:thiamine biosynthesis lipoprotein